MRAWASVLFPEPLGPMITWTSPLRTARSMPCRTLFATGRGVQITDFEDVLGGHGAPPPPCRPPA